jgi:hypothetical protein
MVANAANVANVTNVADVADERKRFFKVSIVLGLPLRHSRH